MSETNIVDIHAARPRRTRRAAKPAPAAGTPLAALLPSTTSTPQ
ncbi:MULTISPECIES: hypothetical protein [Streptosporangium]|uniref:Uncharacterized protein n=1 Tax=Streptosporangium brasiliense TaxID=47480 RepID=A0ABT9QZ04_9ACTN|nr:hypothetical protein [Streptosporangium brasiliense]MDP9862212.1 hypothetical protein [Streptosporangium brasiliense]